MGLKLRYGAQPSYLVTFFFDVRHDIEGETVRGSSGDERKRRRPKIYKASHLACDIIFTQRRDG